MRSRSPLAAVVVLVAGCHSTAETAAGDPDGGSAGPDAGTMAPATGCALATTCGGSAVGTWEFQSACLPGGVSAYTEAQCPGSKWEDVQVSVSGTFTVAADGVLMVNRRAVGSGKLTLPKSCFLPDVVLDQAHCEDMAADVGGIGFHPSCTTDGARCTCTVDLTYNVVAKGSVDQAAGTARYEDNRPVKMCASASTLQLSPLSGEDSMAFLFGLTRK
ncbi:MAG TPA: hypothetical protein VN914_13090 [Polyangia bacterium]|nr:hypothetical protein [Polyangia bacterium]